MKQLLFLCLLVFLSCTSEHDYVSIRQIDSNHPITIGIAHDAIAYCMFSNKSAQQSLKLSLGF